MCGAISPLSQYVFMARCLVKHRDNFTLLYFTLDTLRVCCFRLFQIFMILFIRTVQTNIPDCSRGSRVRFPQVLGIFLFTVSRTVLGPTQPPLQWVPGSLSLGVRRLGRETDHSPPSSAEVKECVELHLHSPIRLHGVVPS
jgi:hypothetical protein